jgi:hypothetical protein
MLHPKVRRKIFASFRTCGILKANLSRDFPFDQWISFGIAFGIEVDAMINVSPSRANRSRYVH